MNTENYTSVTDFVLTGLEIQENLQGFLFLIILLIYILTLIANLSIMIISAYDASLHTPMYFFLYNLAILDIFYSSSVVPKMLLDIVSQEKKISFYGCMLQVHFFHFLGSAEVALFSVMSFDRYVAIAHPLRYTTIMNYKLCLCLASYSWAVGFSHAVVHTIMTSKLPFCGLNVVKHFFCDIKPLLKLACTDVSFNIKLLVRFTGPYAACHLVLTMLSYIFIGKCLIKIKTSQGRRRALSTCSGHFTVVTLQYGTVLFTYARPSSKSSLDQDRAAAIMFTVVTPALNPILYTIRNKDFKKGLKKFFKMSH